MSGRMAEKEAGRFWVVEGGEFVDPRGNSIYFIDAASGEERRVHPQTAQYGRGTSFSPRIQPTLASSTMSRKTAAFVFWISQDSKTK